VIERTNLLLDYSGKFINQTNANNNPILNFSESRPPSGSKRSTKKCASIAARVEHCRSQINNLDKSKKHQQLLALKEAIKSITSYFVNARKNCDYVLSKLRCRKLIVSRKHQKATKKTVSSGPTQASFHTEKTSSSKRHLALDFQANLFKIRLQLHENRLRFFEKDFHKKLSKLEICFNQFNFFSLYTQ
jgi:hypothetical protein